MSRFKQLSIKLLCVLAMVFTLSAVLGVSTHPVQAQVPMQLMDSQSDEKGSDGEQGASEDSEEEDKGSSTIGLGEAIHLDSFVERWERQFNQWMADLGFGESIGAQLIMTAIILLITLVVLWVVKKLVKMLRSKLEYLSIKVHMSQSKLNFLYGALYWLFAAIVLLISVISVGITWGLDVDKFIANDFVIGFFTQLLTIYVIVLIAAVILELASGLVEKGFTKWGGTSTARVNTLLPIAKNTVYIVLIIMFSLVGLSEIGIDVMPLLAGAGVIGFAVGFAAQAFIKDLLMGFIIILEDLIQVGDVARVADRVGVVERITIRKVQLRDLGGSVFTVPFSEISIVENLTKEFSCAVFDIGVAYREDVDEVMKLLEQVGKEMMEDDTYKEVILEPMEIFGLDKFGDSALVIKGRFKTQPIKQWMVSREFNRRVKIIFDQHNIEIPFPHQTLYFGEDKEGNAPPLRLSKVDVNEAAANEESDAKKGTAKVSDSSLPNENEIDE